MAYSSYFGTAPYKSLATGDVIQVPDMTKHIAIEQRFLNDSRYYLNYTLKDGDRLDQLADRLYDDPDLLWLIISANGMYNLSEQFPVDDTLLVDYIKQQYPFNKLEDVHHYEDPDGNVVDPYAVMLHYKLLSEKDAIAKFGLQAVSIYDYEYGQNEAKRHIKLVDPDLVGSINRQIAEAFDGTS